jgi:hypothetical protein
MNPFQREVKKRELHEASIDQLLADAAVNRLGILRAEWTLEIAELDERNPAAAVYVRQAVVSDVSVEHVLDLGRRP